MPDEGAMELSGTARPYRDEWTDAWPQTRQEFEAFVDLYLDRLVRSAFRRLGNQDEAEDVVQDVFVKSYADREKLQKVQRVGPYLYRMVANACNEKLSQRRRRVLSFDELESEDIPDTVSEASKQIAAVDELQRIEQLLRRLPSRQAEVIRLRVLDQLPLTDIAQVIGCNLPTVKSRLRYALEKLRRIVPQMKEGS